MQAGESSTRRERLHVSVGFLSQLAVPRKGRRQLGFSRQAQRVLGAGVWPSCCEARTARAVRRRSRHSRHSRRASADLSLTRPGPLSCLGSAEGRRHGRGLGHEGDTPREDGGGRGGRHTARCTRYRLRMRHRGRQAGDRLRPRRRARQRRPLRQEGPGGGRAVRAGALHLGEQGLTGCEAGCRAASGLAGRTVNSL